MEPEPREGQQWTIHGGTKLTVAGTPFGNDPGPRAIVVVPASHLASAQAEIEGLREALNEVRRATTFDNCCGQLRKIEKLTDRALSNPTKEAE